MVKLRLLLFNFCLLFISIIIVMFKTDFIFLNNYLFLEYRDSNYDIYNVNKDIIINKLNGINIYDYNGINVMDIGYLKISINKRHTRVLGNFEIIGNFSNEVDINDVFDKMNLRFFEERGNRKIYLSENTDISATIKTDNSFKLTFTTDLVTLTKDNIDKSYFLNYYEDINKYNVIYILIKISSLFISFVIGEIIFFKIYYNLKIKNDIKNS